MNKKEWIDDMVFQRMELLLNEFYCSKENTKTVDDTVLTQAEDVTKRLTKKEWEALNRFLAQINKHHSIETSYLYVCGLKDNLRTMKFINSL